MGEVVVGVDVSVARGLDAVVLDPHRRILDARDRLTADQLDGLLRRWQPSAVAIDSPPGPGREPGATARRPERELRALGVNVFLTPSDPARYRRPFYDWIRVGAQVYAVAEHAGYPLFEAGGSVRGRSLEVFPHASDVFLRGRLPPPGTTRRPATKRAWRLRTLASAGVTTEHLCRNQRGVPTLDSIDAALAALTALHAVTGDFTAVGADGEWIVVPGAAATVAPAKRSWRRLRSVEEVEDRRHAPPG